MFFFIKCVFTHIIKAMVKVIPVFDLVQTLKRINKDIKEHVFKISIKKGSNLLLKAEKMFVR